jgi:hypothetical protein
MFNVKQKKKAVMKKTKTLLIAAAILIGVGTTTYSFAITKTGTRCSGTSTYDGPIHSCEGSASNCTYAC